MLVRRVAETAIADMQGVMALVQQQILCWASQRLDGGRAKRGVAARRGGRQDARHWLACPCGV